MRTNCKLARLEPGCCPSRALTPTRTRRSAKKFPGYTAENLSEKGIHEVSQRRFVLVSADHPIVSAISENAEYAAILLCCALRIPCC